MSDMPERIWLDWPGANHGEPIYTEPPQRGTQAGQTEYIRADIVQDLTAELSACTESPGGCGYWRERSKALTTERDEALECNEQFFVDNQFLKKRAEKAEAERDRLREALEYILAECTLSDNTMPSVGAIKYAARAALKGETP